MRARSATARRILWLVFRWLAVLPVAVLAVYLVGFPVHWVAIVVAGQFVSPPDVAVPVFDRLGQAFVSPFCFIYVGYRLAPSLKMQTAGLLVILWAMFFGAIMFYAAVVLRSYTGLGWLELVLMLILSVCGTIAGLYGSFSHWKSKRFILEGSTG